MRICRFCLILTAVSPENHTHAPGISSLGCCFSTFWFVCMIWGPSAMSIREEKAITKLTGFTISFFTVCHIFFLILGILKWLLPVSNVVICMAAVLVICSRILNGRILFGKIHWHHYIVTLSLMAVILIFNFFDL